MKKKELEEPTPKQGPIPTSLFFQDRTTLFLHLDFMLNKIIDYPFMI